MNAAPVQELANASCGNPIVREVDGIVFNLPSATRQGAEQARVSRSDLARYLGYKDKDSLRQLADRNATELADFGEICAVQVSVKRGPVTYQALEPTYNPDQCILLGLASQTEIGRSIRVRILKACKALLAEFEQRPLTPIRQLLAIVQAQADIEERQLEQERQAQQRGSLNVQLAALSRMTVPELDAERDESMSTPDILGRCTGESNEYADARARTIEGPKISLEYTSGACGDLQVETFTSVDDEDRGGIVIRISLTDGGSSFVPLALTTPKGIEIHMAGDAEAATLVRALRGVLAALPDSRRYPFRETCGYVEASDFPF